MKRNFTLDAGVRFYYMTPTRSDGDRWRRSSPANGTARRRRTISAGLDASRPERAEPADRRDRPGGYIGRLVPGSGNFINGMHTYDGTPQDNSRSASRRASRSRGT